MLIISLTYLFSVKPQRKKKPKSKTHRSNVLLVEKFILKFLHNSTFQEYYQTLSLSSIKYQELIDLCKKLVIPRQYLVFYIALPHGKVIPEKRDYQESDDKT